MQEHVSADSKGLKFLCFDTDSWVRGSVDSKEDRLNVRRSERRNVWTERRNVKEEKMPPPPRGLYKILIRWGLARHFLQGCVSEWEDGAVSTSI